MIYILSFMLIIFGVIGFIIEKNIFNFLTIFNFMWAVIVFLSSFELFDMNAISSQTYILVAIGCLFYTIGYSLYNLKPVRLYIKKMDKGKKHIITRHFFLFILIVTILWGILAVKVFSLLINGIPYQHIRDIYSGKDGVDALFTIKYMKTIWKVFAVPSVYVILVEVISSIFTKRYSTKYYVIAIILLFLYCFVTGSRIILFVIIGQMLFLIGFMKANLNDIIIKSKIKKYIKRFVIIMIIGIIIITVLRTKSNRKDNDSKLMTYYAYGTVTMPLMDYWIDYIEAENVETYGGATFNGIITLLKIVRIPIIDIFNDSMEFISFFSNTYVPVFGNSTYNAFVSIFFYFYIDFKYIGVILGCLFFGWTSSYVSYNAKKTRDNYSINVILLFLIAVIKSFARWEFAQFDYIMMFIINAYIYKYQKENNKKMGDNNGK